MCLAIAAGACGAESGADGGTSIRLASTGSVMSLPVWVAAEQGYFEDNGLDVEIDIITTTVGAQVPSLLGKQYDLGQVNGPVLLTSAEGGIDIVAASGGARSSDGDENTLLIARPESGISSPKDLEGKRVAAPSISGNVNTGTMYWLAKQGVNIDSVEAVAASTPNMPDLLRVGQVDAAEVTMPFAGQLLDEGYTSLQDIGIALGDPTLMITWASTREWAEQNSEAIAAFRRSIDQATQWIEKNSDAAIDLLMTKTKIEPQFKKHLNLATYTSEVTVAELEAWREAMRVVNGFSTDVELRSLIFTPR